MSNRLQIENSNKRPAAVDLPTTWEAAFAALAERVADRFEALDGERSREVGHLNDQVDDLRALVTQLTDRVNEAVTALGEVQRAVASGAEATRQALDDQAREAGELVDGLTGELKAVGEAVDAAQATLKGVQQVQADYGTDAAQRDAVVQDLRALVQTTAKGLEDAAARATAAAEKADQAREAGDKATREAGDATAALVQLRETVDQVSAAHDGIAQVVEAAARTARDAAGEVADAVRLVNDRASTVEAFMQRAQVALAQTARGFLIDQAGELVAIRSDGEQVPLGRVVGRDGVSPAAPAQLVAAAVDGDQVRFILSDGTEHRAKIQISPPPADPVTIPSEAKYNGHSVADMQKMRASGTSFAQIGKLCGISSQYVARLIKRAEKDAPKA